MSHYCSHVSGNSYVITVKRTVLEYSLEITIIVLRKAQTCVTLAIWYQQFEIQNIHQLSKKVKIQLLHYSDQIRFKHRFETYDCVRVTCCCGTFGVRNPLEYYKDLGVQETLAHYYSFMLKEHDMKHLQLLAVIQKRNSVWYYKG